MLEGLEAEILEEIIKEKKIDKSAKLALEKKLQAWERRTELFTIMA
jgi:hypothetical protein